MGFFGAPFRDLRLATVLRLLPAFALALAFTTFSRGSVWAAESPGESSELVAVFDIIVPLGPRIDYVVAGPQPIAWVPLPSRVTLLVPGDIPGATVRWFHNGEQLPGSTSVQHVLGVVDASDAGYYLADVTLAGGGGQVHAIQLFVFDSPPSGSRLLNSSLRAGITAQSRRLIGGIVVGPQPGYAVLVRAIGPALAGLGVARPLPDPELHFFDSAGNSADGYILSVTIQLVGAPTIEEAVEAARQSVGAFPLPAGGGDVAYLVFFPPGAFTAHVTSKSGATGEVLLEFYDVPGIPLDSAR